MEKKWTFNCGLTLGLRWWDQYKTVHCPWNFLCLIKMCEWADEQRDCEGVYSWRRSVRYVYSTWNIYEQTIKTLPYKIWKKIWLHILYKFTLLTVSTYESIYMMLCTHKNPCLFQFYGSSARWVLVSNCINLALKQNRKQNNASTAIDRLICITPTPLSFILMYQNKLFTAKEHNYSEIWLWLR